MKTKEHKHRFRFFYHKKYLPLVKTIIMKIYITLILFCANFMISNAQNIISSGGNLYTSNNLMISTTIGEPIIETFSDNDIILTQGFQQPQLKIVGIQNYTQEVLATVYPNPTNSSIILQTKNIQNLSYQLQSIDGKILQHSTINKDLTKISMEQLPANLYLLRLFSKEEKVSKIIKIQKTN